MAGWQLLPLHHTSFIILELFKKLVTLKALRAESYSNFHRVLKLCHILSFCGLC